MYIMFNYYVLFLYFALVSFLFFHMDYGLKDSSNDN